MLTKNLVKSFLIISVIILNIGCDQVSKKIVRHEINPYETIHLLSNHLILTRVENSGAFLSVGDSLPGSAKKIILSFLPFLAIAFGLGYVLSRPAVSKNMLAGLCFVIGGGVGNLVDRIIYGSVTDFLHIGFGFFQTGIFNLADVSIMVGMFMILFEFIFKKDYTPEEIVS